MWKCCPFRTTRLQKNIFIFLLLWLPSPGNVRPYKSKHFVPTQEFLHDCRLLASWTKIIWHDDITLTLSEMPLWGVLGYMSSQKVSHLDFYNRVLRWIDHSNLKSTFTFSSYVASNWKKGEKPKISGGNIFAYSLNSRSEKAIQLLISLILISSCGCGMRTQIQYTSNKTTLLWSIVNNKLNFHYFSPVQSGKSEWALK